MTSLKFWRYINRGLASILLLLILATVGSVVYLTYTLLALNSLIKQGGQAVSEMLTLQNMQIELQGAESAGRGYVLTGDDSYLTLLTSAQVTVPTELATLDKTPLTHSSDYQKLKKLINQRLTGLQKVVDLRRTQGLDAAVSMVNNNRSQAYTEQIRAMATYIGNVQLQTIGPKERQAQANLHRALFVAGLMVVFVLAICAVILRYFNLAIMRERAVEGAKSEFLSLASHQLRTPATNVKQYLGLVLEGYLGDLTFEQREALGVANKNNNTEIGIINDLLDIAKLDLNKIVLDLQPLDAAVVARQVADEHSVIAAAKKQTIKVRAVGKIPQIMADQSYLKSVLENLVDNACKYSARKSTVTIRSRRAQNAKVLISVDDKGIGIKKKDLPKLFKKFSRLPRAIDSAEGSGLGLYWVKRIVELHHGRIDVVSTEGKGSSFIIRLPAVVE
jgi:signal transduction histidine kinase